MSLLENLHRDIEVGRELERKRVEERRRLKLEERKRRPARRDPNRLMLKLGAVMEKLKPIHPVLRWTKKGIGELMRYAKRDFALLAGKVKRRMVQ